MAKRKSRLNQAFAAAQAKRSELAHAQKVKAAKAGQQQKHQQKQKQKQKQQQTSNPPLSRSSPCRTTVAAARDYDDSKTRRLSNETDSGTRCAGADHKLQVQSKSSQEQVPGHGLLHPASSDTTSARYIHPTPSEKFDPLPEPPISRPVKTGSTVSKGSVRNQPLPMQEVNPAPKSSRPSDASHTIQDGACEASLQEKGCPITHADEHIGSSSLSKRSAPMEEGLDNVSAERSYRRPRCMIDPHDRVLLVGEGNFSFAASLVEHHSHPGQLLTATTNDSEDTVLQKYPDAAGFIQTLRAHNVDVLFKVDACDLHKDKRLKNRKFDRVVFNFPHTGSREADMDRNIKSNQILVLKFLRSVSHILFQFNEEDNPYVKPLHNPPSKRNKKRQKCGSKTVSSDSESDHERHYTLPPKLDKNTSDNDGLTTSSDSKARTSQRPGTVLITLRNCAPYSLWNIPMLAKRGPTLAHSILYPTHPSLNHPKKPQPVYSVIRSSGFFPADYPGYEHRRTNGFQPGRSTHASLDVLLSAKLRSQTDIPIVSDEAKARTWELELQRE